MPGPGGISAGWEWGSSGGSGIGRGMQRPCWDSSAAGKPRRGCSACNDTVWVPGAEQSCCFGRADGGAQGEPFLGNPFLLSLTLFLSCGPSFHGDLPGALQSLGSGADLQREP